MTDKLQIRPIDMAIITQLNIDLDPDALICVYKGANSADVWSNAPSGLTNIIACLVPQEQGISIVTTINSFYRREYRNDIMFDYSDPAMYNNLLTWLKQRLGIDL